MSSFIRWLSPRYGKIRSEFRSHVESLREEAVADGLHRRTPEIVASLSYGLRLFLDFAQDVGGLGDEEAAALWDRGLRALNAAAQSQGQYQTDADPVSRFLSLLTGALAAGRVHVATLEGGCPDSGSAWGWRNDDGPLDGPRPHGDRIGWLKGPDLYLLPEAAYAAVQRIARDGGEEIAIRLNTMKKRLRDRGVLRTHVRGGVERLTDRLTVDGERLEVLHVDKDCVISSENLARVAQPGLTPLEPKPIVGHTEGQNGWDPDLLAQELTRKIGGSP
jgi:hypothetical protein